MNTAPEYSTRVVQEGGRRCKKSILNDLVHLTPLRIPLMNPPFVSVGVHSTDAEVLVRKLRQLIPLSSAKPANPRCFILLCEISCELAGCPR
jgi:hypothetical protein